MKLGDGQIPTVNALKNVGSMFAAEGCSKIDVNNRVEVALVNGREKCQESCVIRICLSIPKQKYTKPS